MLPNAEANASQKDIELETIKLRLEGVRLCSSRSRFAFLVSLIASVAIIVTVWNAHMSPDSDFALQPHWSHDKQFTLAMQTERLESALKERKLAPERITEVTDQVQQQLVAEWIKNQVISVGLFGIRISVEDFAVLGSLSLLITAMWLFYSVRAENLSIGNLFKHANKLLDWDTRYFVYQGIVPHLIFLDLGHGDKPIDDFEQYENLSRPKPLIRRSIKLLLLLPAFTILIIVAADMLTLFYAANPFHPSGVPLWRILDRRELVWRVGTDVIASLLFVFAFVKCHGVLKYSLASGKLIEKFRDRLFESFPDKGKHFSRGGESDSNNPPAELGGGPLPSSG